MDWLRKLQESFCFGFYCFTVKNGIVDGGYTCILSIYYIYIMYSHMYIYIYVRAYRIQSNPEETIIFLGKAKEAPPAQKSEDVSPEAAN
jgi:hypothetical protein